MAKNDEQYVMWLNDLLNREPYEKKKVVVVRKPQAKRTPSLKEVDQEALKKAMDKLHETDEPTDTDLYTFMNRGYASFDATGKAKDPVVQEVRDIEQGDEDFIKHQREIARKRYMINPALKEEAVKPVEKTAEKVFSFLDKPLTYILGEKYGAPVEKFLNKPFEGTKWEESPIKKEDAESVGELGRQAVREVNESGAEAAADEEEGMWKKQKKIEDYEPLPDIKGSMLDKAQYAAKKMLFSDKVPPKIKTALSKALDDNDQERLFSLTRGYLNASQRLEMIKDRQNITYDREWPDDPIYYLDVEE